MTTKIGVGVIGVGAIGRVHAENLAKRVLGAKLVGIADVNLSAAGDLAARLGVSTVYADYNQLLADRRVEAVVVATPPFLKREIVIAAAATKKHIFCEKPMTLTLEDADAMVEAVDDSRVVFQVGYQKRSDTSFLRAKRAIESGEVGKLLLVRSHNRDPPTTVTGWSADPRKSGSVFLDTCSHDFDAIRWLTGSEVERVYADGNAMMYEELRKNGDYDTVVVDMKLSNGAMAQVDACAYTPYGFDSRAEVVGTEGGVIVEMGEASLTHVFKSGSVSNESHSSWGSRWAQAYLDEMEAFAESVVTGKPPRATIQDGRAALEIGIAAWQSVKGTKPYSLPLRKG